MCAALLSLENCKPRLTPQARYDVALAEFREGHIDTALKLADEGYRELETQDALWSWRFRLLDAEVLLWKGLFDQSNALLTDAPPQGAPSDITARRKILQGRTLCRVGKPVESGAALDEAERLIGPGDPYWQAELAFARGKCASLSDVAAAQTYYQQSATLAHGIDNFIEARGILDVGNLLLQGGHFPEAIHAFDQVRTLTDSDLWREAALGDLGFIYSQLGEFRRAAYFSEQAVNISSKLHNRRNKKKWLIDLGAEHFSQLEYPEAEKSFQDALAIARELSDPYDTAICLNNLAQLALRTNDLRAAEDFTRQLKDLNPKDLRYVDLLLNEAELAKAKQDFPASEQILGQLLQQVQLLQHMPGHRRIEPTVLWKTQSDLAAVYVAQQKFVAAEDMFRKAVRTATAAWSSTEGVQYKISFLDQAPFYDAYVRFLLSRNRPLEALDIAELGRSPTLSEPLEQGERTPPGSARLKRIQKELGDRGVVLAYWLGWEESYLFAITSSRVKTFRLPPELEIETKVEAYNREIRKSDRPEESKTGQDLYEILVRPAKTLIPKDANVIIVPHRKLYNFNFETLIVPGAKPHYWIDDVHLQNVSFLSALTNSRPSRSASTKDLLLVGDPIFFDNQFPVLKHALEEMDKVAGHFPRDREDVIRGKDATPPSYLASDPGRFRYLHFATHGTSSTVLENPLDAAIILSPAQNIPVSAGDPMGAYHLYGRDIMKTSLHAELVTVSACYGMGREYSGEGLVGLSWAFLRAGAHQVVAALWEVDEASSPQLMDDFYGELTHGKSAAEALRDAKLKMLHSNTFYQHPYYWASLQLYTGS